MKDASKGKQSSTGKGTKLSYRENILESESVTKTEDSSAWNTKAGGINPGICPFRRQKQKTLLMTHFALGDLPWSAGDLP